MAARRAEQGGGEQVESGVVHRVPATRMPVIEEAVGAQSLVAHDGKAVPASAVESKDLVSKVKLDGSSHVTYWIDVEVRLLTRNLQHALETDADLTSMDGYHSRFAAEITIESAPCTGKPLVPHPLTD